MANWLYFILVAVVAGFLITWFLPGTGIYIAITGFGMIFGLGLWSGRIKFQNIGKKPAMTLTVIMALGFFYFGGFAMLIPGMDMSLFGGLGTATVAGVPGAVTSPVVPATGCAAGAQNYGEATTITLHTYDLESNTPYASEVDLTTNCLVYKISGTGESYLYTSDDTSNAQDTGAAAVGDVVRIYCGGTSYYADVSEACITNAAQSIDIDAHTIQTETNMQITGYDDTEAATLSAGTNTSQEDYDITMGADAEESFYLKLKANAANAAFRLGGIAALARNHTDKISLVSGGFTAGTVPDFLTNLEIGGSAAAMENNITGESYNYFWRINTPVMLHEWDSVKYQFSVETDSTDPVTTNDFLDSNMAIICFLDAQYAKGDDGLMHLDVYQHDSGEANVGMTEDFTLPVGKTTCVVIELI